MRPSIRRLARSRQWMLPVLAAVSVTACHSSPEVIPDRTQAEMRGVVFDEQLALSTRSINAGDLAQARRHLEQASAAAYSPSQHAKVSNLDRFISGAEALLDGDMTGTRAAWGEIDDPTLRDEVGGKSSMVGVALATTGETEGE